MKRSRSVSLAGGVDIAGCGTLKGQSDGRVSHRALEGLICPLNFKKHGLTGWNPTLWGIDDNGERRAEKKEDRHHGAH